MSLIMNTECIYLSQEMLPEDEGVDGGCIYLFQHSKAECLAGVCRIRFPFIGPFCSSLRTASAHCYIHRGRKKGVAVGAAATHRVTK